VRVVWEWCGGGVGAVWGRIYYGTPRKESPALHQAGQGVWEASNGLITRPVL
jgi:hypothetical protein